jgi:hypothetical protein
MSTNEQQKTAATPVFFGDWPLVTLEQNPLSPEDGNIAVALAQATFAGIYLGYTLVYSDSLMAGILYRPDGTPVLVRGKWLVVADRETAQFCVELDAYWCAHQSTEPETDQQSAA